MRTFLVCSLDDEAYADAEFSVYRSLEEAKEECIRQVSEFYFLDREKAIGNMTFEEDVEAETFFPCTPVAPIHVYTYSYAPEFEDHFFVNQIIELDIEPGTWLCVWHHAYDGVAFHVLKAGSREECKAFMQKVATEAYLSCQDGSDWNISRGQISYDNGDDWECFDLVVV